MCIENAKSNKLLKKYKYGDINDKIKPNNCYEFTNIDEVELWGKERWCGWAKSHKRIYNDIRDHHNYSMCLKIHDPVELYCGYSHHMINGYLRKKLDTPESNLLMLISNLIVAILSAPVINQNIVLYRIVPPEMIEDLISHNKKGEPYQEKGFMSTSMLKPIHNHKDYPNDYSILKIYVDHEITPIHAIYANAIAKRDEAELLLPPNLYIYMVNYPFNDKGTGKTIYEVTIRQP